MQKQDIAPHIEIANSKNPSKPYIRSGAKALIYHNGKFLIVREKVARGVINDFPGGGIDVGEPILDALRREVFEEVGLQIKVEGVVGAWDFLLPDFANRETMRVQILCVGYLCTLPVGIKQEIDTSKNPAHGENIFEYEWVDPEFILDKKNNFFVYDAIYAAVAQAVEIISYRNLK